MPMNPQRPPPIPEQLLEQVGLNASGEWQFASEQAWVDVIRTMDLVYADLVRNHMELERKNEELEQAQQFISSVLSAMTDVLLVCDTQARILQVNAAFEKLTGTDSASIVGKGLDEFFDADSRLMAEALTQRLGKEALIDCEVAVRCHDGSTTPLALNCSPRHDRKGRLAGAVIIGRPVGELRRAYEELNQAHRQLKQTQQQLVHSEKMASLGRLVAGVAHELNNPISFVFGNMHALRRYGERLTTYLEAVEKRIDDDELKALREALRIPRVLQDMEPLIEGTLEGAERVSDIVQELKRFSGGQQEQDSEFNLPQTVRKAVDWVVKTSGVKMQLNYQLPDTWPYWGCKGRVHQIVVNLVQNALDAMSGLESPRLEVAMVQTDGKVTIEIDDWGPGIAEADLAKIFDPFFTSKPVGQGTGLGLYISYGMAKEMGGDLTVENREQGGARFRLILPAQRGESHGA